MYGIEAINASNGWAISVVGISIVFTGLVVLSLVISQLHKAVALFENPQRIKAWFTRPEDVREPAPEAVLTLTMAQKEITKQFALLVRTMDDHFSLPRLLHLSKVSGIKNPDANLRVLLKSRIILPDGEGFFTWDQAMFSKTIA